MVGRISLYVELYWGSLKYDIFDPVENNQKVHSA